MQVETIELKTLVTWLAATPSISRAWVFGSRAKNCANLGSDLDVALELKPEDGEASVEWIKYADEWRFKLNSCTEIRPTVHLEIAQETDDIVWPAVCDHGILIYSRDS